MAQKSITYIDASGATLTTDTYIVVDGNTTELGDGIYYVEGGKDLTISNTIMVTGNATLILADTAYLTVKPADATTAGEAGANGITLYEGATLTVTAQSLGADMGTLKVMGAAGAHGLDTTLTSGGGNAGDGGRGGYAINSNITVNAGNLKLYGGGGGKGGNAYDEYELPGWGGEGGDGGWGGTGITGHLTVNNGNITVVGGEGGEGGFGSQIYKAGAGGNGGKGINGNLTIKNGNITVTGGTGGRGGNGWDKTTGYGGEGGTGIHFTVDSAELTCGTVTVTGGTGGGGGNGDGRGGYGGLGISDTSLTLDGTTLTVTGGNSGNCGYTYPEVTIETQEAGSAIGGNLTIKSGTLTATGGNYGCDSQGKPSQKTVSAFDDDVAEIFVDKDMILKAGKDAATAEPITHTSTDNLKDQLEGAHFVSAEMLSIQYTVSGAGTYNYDGTAKTVNITVSDPSDGAQIWYSIDGQKTWNDGSSYSLTDAGSVTVYFKVEAEKYNTAITEGNTITINPKELTVSNTSVADKIYDGNTTATVNAGKLDGVIGSDDVKLSATGEFADKNTGDDKTVTVSYSLSGDKAGNYKLAQESSDKFTASISKKKVTVQGTSVDDKDYDGNTNASVNPGELQNTIKGDNVILSASGEFNDKNAGTNKDVSVYNQISGTDAGNYVLITETETLQANIYQQELTVAGTGVVPEKVYDGNTTAEITVQGVLQGVVQGDVVSIDTATGTFDNKNAGEDKTVTVKYTLTGDDAGNYTVANGETYSTITKREITLTSGDATKVYDGTELTKAEVTATNVVDGEGFYGVNYASQTEVGSTPNTFEYKALPNTNENNYIINVINGGLIVTATQPEIKEPEIVENDAVLIVPDTQEQEVVSFNIMGENATVQNNSDENVSVSKVAATNTATVENNGEGIVSVLDVIGKDVKISNHSSGSVEVIDGFAASGDMTITNDKDADGVIVLGGTNTVGGLTINNATGKVINGGKDGETEQAAKITVTGTNEVTITNNGHLNANVIAGGKMTITNTSANTLIGEYSGQDVNVSNTAYGAAEDVTLQAYGKSSSEPGTVTITGSKDSKFTGTTEIYAGYNANRENVLDNDGKGTVKLEGTNTFSGDLLVKAASLTADAASTLKLDGVHFIYKADSNPEINANISANISGESSIYAVAAGSPAAAIFKGAVTLKDGVVLGKDTNIKVTGEFKLEEDGTFTLNGGKITAKDINVNFGMQKHTETLNVINGTLTATNMLGINNNGTMNLTAATLDSGTNSITQNYVMNVNAGTTKIVTSGSSGFTNYFNLNLEQGAVLAFTGSNKILSNMGTINLKGGVTEEDVVIDDAYNMSLSTVNWDLSVGTGNESNIKWTNLKGTPKFAITVNAEDKLSDSYTLAQNASTATDKVFTLQGIGTETASITVGGDEVLYGKYYYTLKVDNNNLVFTADRYANPLVTVTTEEKWFKEGETVTVEGTVQDYVGCGIDTFTVKVGEAEAVQVTLDKTETENLYSWSYTYKGEDTKDTKLTFTATDKSTPEPLVGTAEYTLQVDTLSPAIGTVTLNGEEYTGAWMSVDPKTAVVTIKLDDATSGIDASSLKINYDGLSPWTAYSYDAETGVITVNKGAISEGSHTLVIDVSDNAGNALTGTSRNVTVNLDVTAPKISDVTFNGYKDAKDRYWFQQDSKATMTAKITDWDSKVASTDFNGVAGVKGEGTSNIYTFTLNTSVEENYDGKKVSATDNAGNIGYSTSAYNYGIDGTAATISDIKVNGEIGSNGWYNIASGEVTITGTSADTLSGVDKTEYSVNGGNWSKVDGTTNWTLTAGESAKAAGDVYSFRATDNVGNVSTEAYKTDAVKIDKTGPSAVITVTPANPDGTNDWYKTKPTYTVVATDNLSGVWKIDYTTDGTTWQNLYIDSDVTTAETSVTQTLDVADTTGLTYQFRVTDVAGNEFTAPAQQAIKVDTILPIIEVTHDPAFQTDEVTVTAKCADKGSGIATQQYKIDDGNWQAYNEAFTVDYNCTITFKATDNAGNERFITHVVDNIDIVAPVITIDADTETVMENVAFSVTAVDVSYTTLTKFEYSTDGGETWTQLPGTPDKSVTAKRTAEKNNTTYIFRAIDKAKNVTTESVTFNNIYKGTEETYEIIGIKEVTSNLPVDTAELTMNGDAVLHNNGSVTADTLNVTGTGNVITGNLIEVDEIKLAEGAELGVSKDQYDNFMAGVDFTTADGKLNVAYSSGNALRTQDVDTLMNKKNLANVEFKQDLIDINKLNVKNTKETTIGFEDAYGTSKSDTIRFYKDTDVSFGTAGREINLEEGSNNVQIDKNADIDILSNLTNVSKVTSAKDSVVTMANINFQTGRSATLKAEGKSFTAGNVNGTDKVTSITTAKSTEFTAGDIALGEKSDKISTGKYAAFTANDISSADTISFGAYSEATVGNIEGTKKLTVSSGSSKNGGATFVAKAVTGTSANDSFNFGSCNVAELTSLDFGDGNDTLKLGSNSTLTCGDIVSAETISFGAYSKATVGNIDGTKKLTLSSGSSKDGATFAAKAVIGTSANDSFNFGSYNDAELDSLDFGAGNDTLTLGNYTDLDIKGQLDFGDGSKDKLSIGKGSTLSLERLAVETLDKLSMSKESLLVIADAGDLKAAQTKWTKYANQIVAAKPA